MLAVEVELLTGRYAATAYNDRGRAEWPPHPARFFSALTSALYEGESDASEREALLWLEQQQPPSLTVASWAGRREVRDTWVPVNDISTAGDTNTPLHARATAREALASLSSAATAKERKAAEKEVAAAQEKLDAVLADVGLAPSSPSKKDLERGRALLPATRTRQLRTFPVVVPESPTFYFHWSAEAPAELRAALDRLCQRVTRLGHSSSLVRCVVVDEAPSPNLVPDDDGDVVLRTVGPGQLERLDQEHARHRQVELRVLPAQPQRYGAPSTKDASERRPASVFSRREEDWILFERVGGAPILSSKGVELGRALRAALLEAGDGKTLPSTLSGHSANGDKATAPHAAFVTLPFVGREHADASVQGIAIVLPHEISHDDRAQLLRLIAQWERARGANGDVVTLAGVDLPPVQLHRISVPGKSTLKPGFWSRASRRFVTATPIALDRHPGNLRSNVERTANKAAFEAQQSIGDACERIGLPRPSSVDVSFAPLLVGSQHAHAFRSRAQHPNRPARVRVHADVVFDEAVRGPVLIGAGRFFGLGLCLPMGD